MCIRDRLDLVQELLVALGHLRRLFDAAVDHLEVCHDELQVDGDVYKRQTCAAIENV